MTGVAVPEAGLHHVWKRWIQPTRSNFYHLVPVHIHIECQNGETRHSDDPCFAKSWKPVRHYHENIDEKANRKNHKENSGRNNILCLPRDHLPQPRLYVAELVGIHSGTATALSSEILLKPTLSWTETAAGDENEQSEQGAAAGWTGCQRQRMFTALCVTAQPPCFSGSPCGGRVAAAPSPEAAATGAVPPVCGGAQGRARS